MSDKKDKKTQENKVNESKIKKVDQKQSKKCKSCEDKKQLQKEIKLLKEKNANLEKQIFNIKNENIEAQEAFMEQAKTFQDKAKQKVAEFKAEHKDKMEQEIEHIKKYSTSKFFKEIIEPWLNLELAVQFGEKQDDAGVKNYVIGFKMLLKQIDSIMESHGLTKIVPQLEETFDPETMDAISTIEKEGSTDKVVEIKKHGFKHHDRIIKPATVVIGK